MCRKRPTASLVSRKVLTPLLGQIVLAIAVQFIGFVVVQEQPWYTTPGYKLESMDCLWADHFQQVYPTKTKFRQDKYQEFRKHHPIPNILLPVYPFRSSPQCRPSFSTVHVVQL